MQRRGRVQREREQLLGRERAVAVEQLAQRRAFEVLEQQVRQRPVEHRVERADDRRVAEPLERGGLGGEVAQRDRVATCSGRSTFATSTARRWSSQTRNTS